MPMDDKKIEIDVGGDLSEAFRELGVETYESAMQQRPLTGIQHYSAIPRDASLRWRQHSSGHSERIAAEYTESYRRRQMKLEAEQRRYRLMGKFFAYGILTIPDDIVIEERLNYRTAELVEAIMVWNNLLIEWSSSPWSDSPEVTNDRVLGVLDLETGEQWRCVNGGFRRCKNGNDVVSMPPSWKARNQKQRRRRRGKKWLR